MSAEGQHLLRIFFIPLMCPGHMIPMIDMAKLFSRRGVAATIVTTPGNEPLVRPSIDRANAASPTPVSPIQLLLLPFPTSVSHFLPNGQENLRFMSQSEHLEFFSAFYALQQALDDLLRDHRPDCIVSDSLFTLTADTALALGIPRLIFHGPGIFPLSIHESLELHAPHKNVSDDSEVFVVEGLPHRIEMTRAELSIAFQVPTMLDSLREAAEKSYGIVVNSFYELEPACAELYRKKPGRRAWYVGPVSLCNKDSVEKADRGQKLNPETEGCLSWLDSMATGSVVYVCFGSLNEFSAGQLREIALGLEASGQPFVWVVRNGCGKKEPDWLPKGFEERVEGKGVVIRGWAPQIVILNHPAVGGFVTHCGWNSTLEGVSAGVPMVTWPVEYEQFVNEKFITQVVEIGVSVGRGEVVGDGRKVVKREEIAKAVKELMGSGEEAEERRRRARKYAAMAKEAMEEGGSSYMDMSRLIDEVWAYQGLGEGMVRDV